jgi:hypothetical protein
MTFSMIVDDLEAALLGLLEDRLDLRDQAAGLEVELDAGDALAGAGDLEVHVAEEVLFADDVGDEDSFLSLSSAKRPTEMPAQVPDGHAGVHERQAAAADRGHRRGAVGLGDVADDADGVGEVSGLGRMPRRERSASAPWPISRRPGAHDALGLAGAEGREVVVEVNFLEYSGMQAVDDLLVLGGAQGAGDRGSGSRRAGRGRAVGAGEDADGALDGADLLGLAAVGADALLDDERRVIFSLEALEGLLGEGTGLGGSPGRRRRRCRRS